MSGGMRIVAIIASAGLQWGVRSLLSQPAVDLIMTLSAKIDASLFRQTTIFRTMWYMTIEAFALRKRIMHVVKRHSNLKIGMTTETEIVCASNNQLLTHITVSAVALRTVPASWLMTRNHCKLIRYIAVALYTEFLWRVDKQCRIARAMCIVAIEAGAVGNGSMQIRAIGNVMAHCAKLAPLHLNAKRIIGVGRIVARLAFATCNRSVNRCRQQPRILRSVGSVTKRTR